MARPGSGWGRAQRWRPLAGVAPAALLVLVAIWEIAVIARIGNDVPGDDEWHQASAALRAEHRPGDLIVFAPRWIDPVGRLHLGDLIPVEMAARMDGARYSTIWELSIRGARAPETRGLEAESVKRFGALTMRRFVREPASVVTDFLAELPAARKKGRATVALEEVGFEPHQCILTRPRPRHPVTITFLSARLGTELVGYIGVADVFTRRDNRVPGRLEVFVGGEKRADGTISGGKKVADETVGVDDGWVRFAAATTPGVSTIVVFKVTVESKARDRRICFAAEARE